MCGQDSHGNEHGYCKSVSFLHLLLCNSNVFHNGVKKQICGEYLTAKCRNAQYVTISEDMKVLIISLIVVSGWCLRHERLYLPSSLSTCYMNIHSFTLTIVIKLERQRDLNLAIQLIEGFLCLSKRILAVLKVSHEPYPTRPPFTTISYSTLAWADTMQSVKRPSADWAIAYTPPNFLPNGYQGKANPLVSIQRYKRHDAFHSYPLHVCIAWA
jgi:hypothetical protein